MSPASPRFIMIFATWPLFFTSDIAHITLPTYTKIYIEFVNHLFGHGSALAQLAATALQAAWRGYVSRGRRMAGRLGA